MHIPFTPLCNLHFNIDFVLQFMMEYIMCVYILEQRIDAHKIWQRWLLTPASGSSALMLN